MRLFFCQEGIIKNVNDILMYKKVFIVLLVALFSVSVAQANMILNLPPEGSGKPYQVTFWTGSTKLAGAQGLFWNPSAKRLGIGITVPPVAALDIKTETDSIAHNIYQYFRAAGNSYGVKAVSYAGDGTAKNYGGYFQSSSDSSVKESFGVYGLSDPENFTMSTGVYGEGYSYGVHGRGDVGVYGDAPEGGFALKAKQGSGSGYALYAEGGKNFLEGQVIIGTPTKRSGITLHDIENGHPHCVMVVEGVLDMREGACQ